MASGDKSYFDNDGNSVNVTLTAAVLKDQLVLVQGWLGIASSDGAIGETIALNIDDRAYQLTVPAAFPVAKGAIIYITLANFTGHTIQDAAFVAAAGTGIVAAFKAMEAKDANNVVVAKMLASASLAS
jgi:hypothetical protein